MSDLSKVKSGLPSYSIRDLDSAMNEIEKHGQNKACNNNRLFKLGYGATYNGDYTRMSLKRTFLKECKFKNANFTNAAVTGSRFSNTDFIDCIISGANFQYCDFTGSTIKNFDCNLVMDTSNFSQSNFSNAKLIDINITACTFSQVLFERTLIQNCRIISSTFENSFFGTAYLRDLELRNINIDYADFSGVKMDNVVVPFSQIPYTFGGLSYLFSTSDNVWVSSKINSSNRISVDEYKRVVPSLGIYYLSINEFFPLANIYIAVGNDEYALKAIVNGLLYSVNIRDFRMLKYYCKLATTNTRFTNDNLKYLYERISELLPVSDLTNSELHNYLIHFGEIRTMLLDNDYRKPSLEIIIKTNIDSDDAHRVGLLIRFINRILDEVGSLSKSSYIELRHQSPYEFLIRCIDTPDKLIAVVISLLTLLWRIDKTAHSLLDGVQKWLLIKKLKLEIKQLENKMSSEIKEIQDSGIRIVGASHNMRNIDYKSIDTSLIHSNFK